MTTPTGDATNVADHGANVGVQAQVVHGDIYLYQLPDGATAKEKYETGVKYLDGGMPDKARELIGEAVIEGYDTSEAFFHWMLAFLSRRTYQQFSEEDFSGFQSARRKIPQYVGDQWSDGLKVINILLNSVDKPGADILLAIRELDALEAIQRDKIVWHLEMFLKGPIEDHIWIRALQQAEAKRMANGRKDRVWMFFQANPAEPRVKIPEPVRTTLTDRFWVAVATTLFAAAAGYVGWLLLGSGDWLAPVLYLAGIAGGSIGFAKGLQWRHRVELLRAKEEEHQPPRPRLKLAPSGGFADRVDRLFSRYFDKYMPTDTNWKEWQTGTSGIRRCLRDEIVDIYRETGVRSEQIAWLIRYRIKDVAQRWADGTLWDYRDELRTPAATKLAFAVSLALGMLLGGWAIADAILAKPLAAVTAAVILVGGGCLSVLGWTRILLERRRFKAEQAESRQRLADGRAALDQWQRRLEPRPSDFQMATWLDCDRKLLMHQTLEHYKLKPSQVIAQAFIEAPASNRRARVIEGPWRYSRYQLLAFLLTTDGVRQLIAELDFGKGSFHNRQRINYRFDAVAAVQVAESDDHQRTFELTLINGAPIKVTVTKASTEHTELLQQGEDSDILSRLALDATGLTNTLHVLEGVAAEGKEWIKQENRRRQPTSDRTRRKGKS